MTEPVAIDTGKAGRAAPPAGESGISPDSALRRSVLLRVREGWRSLGRVVQLQVAAAAVGLPALVADYAQRFFTAGSQADREALVPWVVRVAMLGTGLLGLLLARLARGIFLTASDETFLAATPISTAARFRLRVFELALMSLPAVWLGAGAFLPLLWNGDAGLLARGLVLWLAWAACTVAWLAAVAPLTPRPGRGQGAFEWVTGVAPALLLWAARAPSALVVPLASRDSLWITAAIGACAGAVMITVAVRTPSWLARREATLEWIRIHGPRHRRGGRATPRAGTPTAAALPRFGPGGWALLGRNLLLAARNPRIGGPALAGAALKALAFLLLLAPAAPTGGAAGIVAPEGPPWAFAGALLVLGDTLLCAAMLALVEADHPVYFFAAPVSRRAQWWTLAGPPMVLSAAATLVLALLAAASPDGGTPTARFILAWCGLAGISLLVTAANLALAAFPQTSMAQNLFWVGVLVCMILSAAIPLFGWVVLVAFALYSFRPLRHWGPD